MEMQIVSTYFFTLSLRMIIIIKEEEEDTFLKKLLPALFIAFLIVFQYSGSALAATDLADGTYTVDYVILHSDNDSASIANDYWNKPATVTVNEDTTTVKLTLNHSTWIEEYQTPSGSGYADVRVVSTNEENTDPEDNTRVVEFTVDNLAEIIPAKIHVIVPDIDYDHNYTVRHSFDMASASLIEGTGSSTDKEENSSENTEATTTGEESENTTGNTSDQTENATTVKNPPTSDDNFMPWAVGLMLIAGGYLITRFTITRERAEE
jgi:heme uptake protein IsdC